MASNRNEVPVTAQTQEPHQLFTVQPTVTPATTTISDANSNTNNTPTPATTTTTSTTSAPTSSHSSSSPQKTILLINGPNLNLLGYREPSIYGSTKLAEIESHLTSLASTRNIKLLTFQSNHEGAIVDRIHEAFWANLKRKESSTSSSNSRTEIEVEVEVPGTVDGIIINPGAYTHTSVAIRDALAGAAIKFVECHISNVHAREAFRHHSYLSDKAEAVIAGLGVYGYAAALDWWCWKWKGGKLEDAGV